MGRRGRRENKKNSSPVLGEVVEDRRGQWPMAIRENGEIGEIGEIGKIREFKEFREI